MEWQDNMPILQLHRDTTGIENILKKDRDRCDQLRTLYVAVKDFLSDTTIERKALEELANYCPTYLKKLKEYIHELDHLECPIVVAGETSAGKTSLLNLLIGTDVLPVSLLHCTSNICHINNGDKKTAKIYKDGEFKEEFGIDDSTRFKLKGYITDRTEDQTLEIFITWPIPFLKGRLSIVDTPGISDNEKTNSKVREFLAQASAFIYVVNTPNAGGLTKNRLVDLVSKIHIASTDATDRLTSFDPSTAIFVLNKWDSIPACEDEEVFEVIYDSLKDCWPGLKKEQLYKFSTKCAEFEVDDGIMTQQEVYDKLWNGILNLLPKTLKSNARSHFDWLRKLIANMEKITQMRLVFARTSRKERKERLDKIKKLKDNLNKSTCDHLIKLVHNECHQLSLSLLHYLQIEKQKKICTWIHHDLSMLAKQDSSRKVLEKIHGEITAFLINKGNLEIAVKHIKKAVTEELENIDKETLKYETAISKSSNQLFRLALPPKKKNSKVWTHIKTVIKKIPILSEIYYQKKLRHFEKNKTVSLAEKTSDYLERMTVDNIKDEVVYVVMAPVFNWVKSIERIMQQQLEADQKVIDNTLSDRRSDEEIARIFGDLQKRGAELNEKCILYYLMNFAPNILDQRRFIFTDSVDTPHSESDAANISGIIADKADQRFERTDISDVEVDKTYIATAQTDMLKDKASIKYDFGDGNIQTVVISENNEKSPTDFLTALDFKNPMFPEIYGILVKPPLILTSENEDKQRFLTYPKLVIQDLSELKPCKEICDSLVPDSLEHHNFVKKTILAISRALQQLHEEDLAHNDIKLENIFMTPANTIKIQHFGLFSGTPAYKANDVRQVGSLVETFFGKIFQEKLSLLVEEQSEGNIMVKQLCLLHRLTCTYDPDRQMTMALVVDFLTTNVEYASWLTKLKQQKGVEEIGTDALSFSENGETQQPSLQDINRNDRQFRNDDDSLVGMSYSTPDSSFPSFEKVDHSKLLHTQSSYENYVIVPLPSSSDKNQTCGDISGQSNFFGAGDSGGVLDTRYLGTGSHAVRNNQAVDSSNSSLGACGSINQTSYLLPHNQQTNVAKTEKQCQNANQSVRGTATKSIHGKQVSNKAVQTVTGAYVKSFVQPPLRTGAIPGKAQPQHPATIPPATQRQQLRQVTDDPLHSQNSHHPLSLENTNN